jgi:alanine-glyoxylate transaminase/serine-glyoxylate transaminase/serine-pyruvate transaminase
MPGKTSLFVPGPTNMPDRVRQAMDISNEYHRAPGMDKFWHPLINDLKKVFEYLVLFISKPAIVNAKS